MILDTQGWGVSPRGAGYLFGSDVVTQVSGIMFVNQSFVHLNMIPLNQINY